MSDIDDDDENPELPRKYGRGQAPGSRTNQFGPGKSGNYRGRPTRTSPEPNTSGPLDAILADGDRPVTLDTGEKIAMHEFMLRVEAKIGAKGNAYATKSYIDRYEAAKKQRAQEVADVYRKAVLCKETGEVLLKRAADRKVPLWEVWPHPDNIILNSADLGAWYFGGLTVVEGAARAFLHQALKLAEYFVAESGANLRRRPSSRGDRRFFEIFSAQVEHCSEACHGDMPFYFGLTEPDRLSAPSRPDTPRLRRMYKQAVQIPEIRERLAGTNMLEVWERDDVWDLP